MSGNDDFVREVEPGETASNDATSQWEDISLTCIDCRQTFVWTAGEQQFFHQKQLSNSPKRCKPCKKAKNHRLSTIAKARVDGRRPHVVMPAECASCGKQTTVPFYPSQNRPVYCKSCYLEIKESTKADANSA